MSRVPSLTESAACSPAPENLPCPRTSDSAAAVCLRSAVPNPHRTIAMTYLVSFEELASRLERRAQERAEETPTDPVAAGLRWAAEQLRETISTVITGDIWWTTHRTAAECECTVAAVQYWCRHAERLRIRTIRKPSGKYLLHRDDVLRMKAGRERRK